MEIMYVPPLVEMLAGYFILVAGLTIWAGNDSRLPEIVDGVHNKRAVSATPSRILDGIFGWCCDFVRTPTQNIYGHLVLVGEYHHKSRLLFIGCAIGRKAIRVGW